MIDKFKKYDKDHSRLITISVLEFNELIKETNIYIESKFTYEFRSLASINDMNKRQGRPELTYAEYKAKYFGNGATISIINNRNDNVGAEITIAKYLDLKYISIEWNKFNGDKLDIEYAI